MTKFEWCEATYEQCYTRRAFWYSPYDASWDDSVQYGEDPRTDNEFRELAEMEHALSQLPEWTERLVPGVLRELPPCGHAEFPLAYLDIVSAIGSETVPAINHGCYTVSQRWKQRMANYLMCLDAWLAGVGSEDAARELMAYATAGVPWTDVCRGLWEVLGEHTKAKELLIARVLHRQRWWLKTLIWDDDPRTSFCRDEYLGDTTLSDNGSFGDPYFAELENPRVKRLEAELKDISALWPKLQGMIESSWLCAPKAFRFLERVLWQIGNETTDLDGVQIPGFLHIEDTCPDPVFAVAWWQDYLAALDGWWRDEPASGEVARDIFSRLGVATPVRRWLVRLLRYKCVLYQRHAEIPRLVGKAAQRA